MNTLIHRGARFASFGVREDGGEVEFNEYGQGFEMPRNGVAWSYICPQCILDLDLHREVGLDVGYLEDLAVGVECLIESDQFFCCIEGCDNQDAMEIRLDACRCKLEAFIYECV